MKCCIYNQFFIAKNKPTFLIKTEFNHMGLWRRPAFPVTAVAEARRETTSLGLLEI